MRKGNNNFALRDRTHQRQMLHLNLVVKNVGNLWHLTLKEVVEFPYLLKNQMQKVRVYIKEYKVWVGPKEEVGYSWESPLKDEFIPIVFEGEAF